MDTSTWDALSDPVAQAINSLLDHVVTIDQRIEQILARLQQAGIECRGDQENSKPLDPTYLSRIVD